MVLTDIQLGPVYHNLNTEYWVKSEPKVVETYSLETGARGFHFLHLLPLHLLTLSSPLLTRLPHCSSLTSTGISSRWTSSETRGPSDDFRGSLERFLISFTWPPVGLMMTSTEGAWPAIMLADMGSCWVSMAAFFSWRASCEGKIRRKIKVKREKTEPHTFKKLMEENFHISVKKIMKKYIFRVLPDLTVQRIKHHNFVNIALKVQNFLMMSWCIIASDVISPPERLPPDHRPSWSPSRRRNLPRPSACSPCHTHFWTPSSIVRERE